MDDMAVTTCAQIARRSGEAGLLDRLAALAAITPCQIARADMLLLLQLVWIGPEAPLWQEVEKGDDPVLIMLNRVLMMIQWARQEH
jgi:hypothetical protein